MKGSRRNMYTVGLLCLSNIFMTVAWYRHLKDTRSPLWQAILLSWGIAFFEYCLAVPANRIGSETFSKYQLKITQEVITLVVFTVYMCWVFQEWPKWNHIVSFVLILAAVVFAFLPTGKSENGRLEDAERGKTIVSPRLPVP